MWRLPRDKDISGCAISGIMSEAGELFSGEDIINSIAVMRERSNGLGGGFAAYGIYPAHHERYALHLMCEDEEARNEAEQVIRQRCDIYDDEPIPTRQIQTIRARPILHRYFVRVRGETLQRNYELTENDIIVSLVMDVNRSRKAFIFSSGKNMGVFKGVGYPEEIGEFFRLDEYEAHTWISHGRFPTNTTGWWGGAHPFGLLDWAVVHNGEISSYGINRRYLANFGYHCTLQTDTEVITYMFDLLVRKHGLPMDIACIAMAPPFWTQIARMPEEERSLASTLRIIYGGALLNGPFSILVGHSGGMIGFNDRIKLRPMVVARQAERLYISSEEAAIRVVCPSPDEVRYARGGEPIIGRIREESVAQVAD